MLDGNLFQKARVELNARCAPAEEHRHREEQDGECMSPANQEIGDTVDAAKSPSPPAATISAMIAPPSAASRRSTSKPGMSGTATNSRSEERRVGNKCDSTWRSRGSPYQYKK